MISREFTKLLNENIYWCLLNYTHVFPVYKKLFLKIFLFLKLSIQSNNCGLSKQLRNGCFKLKIILADCLTSAVLFLH